MSNQEITHQFRKFGYKIILVGILAILFLVFVIINFFVYFRFMLFWLIFSLIFQLTFGWPTIVAIIFQIILYFIFLFTLGNFKKVAHLLYNGDLIRTHSKMIVVSILRMIGYTLCLIGTLIIMSLPAINLRTIAVFTVALMMIGGSVILIFIAAILDIQVWKSIKSNFSYIIKSKNAKSGANFCIIGAICYIIPFFWFVSEIFKVIGYIKLFSLRNLEDGGVIVSKPPSPNNMQLLPSPLQVPTKKFCANCGTPLKETERFCTSCGFKISNPF